MIGTGAVAITAAKTVTITGNAEGSTLSTVVGSTLALGDNSTFSDAVTNFGTVNVAEGKKLTAHTFAEGSGSYNLVVGINSSSRLVVTGALIPNFITKGKVTYTYEGDYNPATYILIKNGVGAEIVAWDNTYLWNHAISETTNNDTILAITGTGNAVEEALTGNGTVVVDGAITGASTSPVFQDTYMAALYAAPTASAVNAVAESYQPAITANTQASVDAIINAASVNSSRIESQTMALRGGSNKYALNQSVTGVATGEASKNLQGWGQVFGQRADQGDRDGQFGYTANTYGIVLGFDTSMVNDSLLGVALTYSRTKVDADNNSDTTINNYQFSFYGQYDITETTFVRGQAGYARGKNDVTSSTLGDANYDSNQFLVQAELGRNFEVMKNLTVTPSIGNNFVHYSADSYTQTAGPVNPDSLNINEITSKVAVSYNHDLGQGSFLQPNAYLGYRYDIIGAKASSTSSVGGSAVFETPGVTLARGTISAGVGVLYTLTDSVDLSANVDYQHKSAFNSYGGSLKAAYRF